MRVRVSVLTAACVLAAGCGGSGVGDELGDLEDAPMPTYYLGDEFAGLPLTDVERGGDGRALFVYGECDLEGEGDTFVCAEPTVQVQVFPFDADDWRKAVACRGLPSLRGVPTVRHDGLVLATRRTIVKIYARSPAEDLRAARSIRAVGDETPARSLPPPPQSVRDLLARACG
jgi:hypothetical protein